MKNNTKGLSYVELVIVMGMLLALVTVAGTSFSSAWRARSSQAANTADVIMSQSKINTMGGKQNFMTIAYHAKDADHIEDGYYAELYETIYNEDETETLKCYKTAKLGSGRLKILYGESDIADLNKILKLKFDHVTGRLDYIGLVDNISDIPTGAPQDESKISFSFGNTYILTIYRLTGDHGIA